MINDFESIQNKAMKGNTPDDDVLIRQTLDDIESALQLVQREHIEASEILAKANESKALQTYVSGAHKSQNNQAEQQIARLNADTMTAKRVATINQQNTIHSNVVSGYMQLTIICLCVAVVVMFPFAFGAVRNIFRHPFVLMQVLLMIIAAVYIVIVLVRLWANRNHYWMLYQERVFNVLPPLHADAKECKCPSTHPDTHAPVHTTSTEVSCG